MNSDFSSHFSSDIVSYNQPRQAVIAISRAIDRTLAASVLVGIIVIRLESLIVRAAPLPASTSYSGIPPSDLLSGAAFSAPACQVC